MPVPAPVIPPEAYPTPLRSAAQAAPAPTPPVSAPNPAASLQLHPDIVSSKRTVMGVFAPSVLPQGPQPATQPAPIPPPAAMPPSYAELPSSKRTMLGVPTPSGMQVGGEVVPTPGLPAAAPSMPAPRPMPAPTTPPGPKVEVSAAAFQVADPSYRVPTTAAAPSAPSAAPLSPRHAPTRIDRDSLASIPPRRSRVGLVIAILIGLLAVAGIVVVLVYQEEIFGTEEAPTKPVKTADGAVVMVPAKDGATVPLPPPPPPPSIAARLVYSGDGATIELEFGQITSVRPVNEIRLAAGPKAGTPDAVLVPGKKVSLADFFPAGTEPSPGTVKIPLDVTFGDGTTERVENDLMVPYTFRAALVADAPQPTVRVAFRLAGEGRTLEVVGAPVDVQDGGVATYEAAVESLRGKAGVWTESPSRVDLSLPFVVRNAAGVVAEGTAGASVPVVPLRIDFPADASMTTDESVWVRGETAPGATVTLEGAAVTVSESGAFAVEVPLAEGAERSLALSATKAGALARNAASTVRRVTARELEQSGDAWAAALTEQLGYSDFAAAADSFQGRKVDLLGRIASVPSAREGVLSFVLFVDTASGCPAAEVCAVMIHAPTAQALSERQQVRVLGEITGRERTTSETFPELPALRAAFVVPR
jgi:hypothetical protein